MYICRLWCQCSFKHLFFHFLGRWSNLTSSSFRSHQNFLVSMILRGNVARETDASTDLCPFWNPFSSLLVANGFKERAWHPGIQSKLGLLQKGLGWRLWLFDFLCNLYGFADLHRFGDKPTSKPTSFLFSLCFLFLWGGGGFWRRSNSKIKTSFTKCTVWQEQFHVGFFNQNVFIYFQKTGNGDP